MMIISVVVEFSSRVGGRLARGCDGSARGRSGGRRFHGPGIAAVVGAVERRGQPGARIGAARAASLPIVALCQSGVARVDRELIGTRKGLAQALWEASAPSARLGKRVVKIGVTRRLAPMDRVRELVDAPVPSPMTSTPCTFPTTR